VFNNHDVGCVIHFAGLKAVEESIYVPLKYYAHNLGSTTALCEVMKNHNVKNIVFSSSATVYNAINKMPLIDNSLTGGCTNPYGWTKYMSEQIIRDAAANNDISAVMLRYFNPVGAHVSGEIGEDPLDIPNNLMPRIAQTAVGRTEVLNVYGNDYDTPDGTCVRDYIHVMDLAEGHAAAIRYLETHTGAEVFNLGTGRGTSVLELIGAFEQTNEVAVPRRIADRRPGDLAVCYADTEKAKNILGWTAKKTIADACADTWRWIKNPR
jgi:UDP-glucose 4-epimerase